MATVVAGLTLACVHVQDHEGLQWSGWEGVSLLVANGCEIK